MGNACKSGAGVPCLHDDSLVNPGTGTACSWLACGAGARWFTIALVGICPGGEASVARILPTSLVDARDANRGLTSIKALTGQESLPVVFWNDERPRSNWLEQLVLAERISLKPRLLPDDPVGRAKVVGLIAELCSEAGFGWHRRVMMSARLLTEPAFGERERGIGQYLSQKVGTIRPGRGSTKPCEEIVSTFAGLRAAGHDYPLKPA